MAWIEESEEVDFGFWLAYLAGSYDEFRYWFRVYRLLARGPR